MTRSRSGYDGRVRRRAAQRPKISPRLFGVLYSAARLPASESLRIAAGYRFDTLRNAVADDSHELAKLLGVSVRSVQRLRRAYGVARPPGG